MRRDNGLPMPGARRVVSSVVLIVAGIALAAFYYLLFAIADCSADCVAAGERAVPVGLVALGIGLVIAGIALFRTATRQAIGWGLSGAGLVAGIGCVLLFAEDTGGLVWVLVVAALVALVAGGIRRRPRPTEGS